MMTLAEAEWVRLNVLPTMWQDLAAIEELRICLCQAPASDWLGGIVEPAARLWNRDGRSVAWGNAGISTKYLGERHLVEVWHTDRTCKLRTLIST